MFDAAILSGAVSMACGDEDAIDRRHNISSRRLAKLDVALVGQSADDVVEVPQGGEDSVIECCSLRLTAWRRYLQPIRQRCCFVNSITLP